MCPCKCVISWRRWKMKLWWRVGRSGSWGTPWKEFSRRRRLSGRTRYCSRVRDRKSRATRKRSSTGRSGDETHTQPSSIHTGHTILGVKWGWHVDVDVQVQSLQSELQFKEAEINEMKTKLHNSDKNKMASPLPRKLERLVIRITNHRLLRNLLLMMSLYLSPQS